MHLETDRTRLIRASDSGLSILASWDADQVLANPLRVKSKLLAILRESVSGAGSRISIVVDLNGDTVHIPELRGRRSGQKKRSGAVNLQWLDRLLQKYRGRRRYGAGLFKTGKPFFGNRSLRKNILQCVLIKLGLQGDVQRFYILPEAFECSPWLAMLTRLDDIVIDGVFPAPLLIEYAAKALLQSHREVLFCHSRAGRVVRHSLYVDGKIKFTRVLPNELSMLCSQHVSQQIEETLDYLKSREFDLSESPVAIVASDVKSSQADTDAPEIKYIQLPVSTNTSADAFPWLEGNGNGAMPDTFLSETDHLCLSIFAKTDHTQKAALDTINFDRLMEKQAVRGNKSSGRLVYFWSLVILLLGINSWNVFNYLLHDQRNDKNVLQLKRVSESLQSAPLPPGQMKSMVIVSGRVTAKRGMPQRMLHDLGRLNSSTEHIRLDRLEWCWQDSAARCLDDFKAELHGEFPLGDVTSPDDLLIRIVGKLDNSSLNYREEYEYYLRWVASIVNDESFTLIRHQQIPHKSPSEASSQSNDAQQFALVLAYAVDEMPILTDLDQGAEL